MTEQQIRRFFTILAGELVSPATVILTGAAAGSLLGRVRPSLDIDFAVILPRHGPAAWEQLDTAIRRTTAQTGIQANYAEDIDRWGPITLLDYRRHTRPYRSFGRLRVRLLDPAYWTIGKVSRYLDPDVQDLVAVLTRQRVPAQRLIRLWARALASSPRSLALGQFRRQAEHFLRTYGRTIWGRAFNPSHAVVQLSRLAGPRRSKPRRSPAS